MPIELTRQESDEAIASLQRYLREELDLDAGDMRARLLLNYILEELAPLAYNRGVKDAEDYFRAKVEDLPGTCFEQPMRFWQKRRK